MNGGVSAPFIRRPIATTLIMVGIAFIGIVAYPLLPVAPLPQVDFPTIQVTANLPAASTEATYVVVGNSPIAVFREEDYNRTLNMDNNPTPTKKRR